MRGFVAVVWGLSGLALLLGSAVYRLTARGWEAFSYSFGWHHWLALAVVVVWMAYSEGYRGFQQAFSPRVAARSRYLRDHASLVQTLLAPLFLMGYFGTSRRRQIISIVLTVAIVLLVILIRMIPQPWRGILDLGVVVGLGWGIVTLLFHTSKALTTPHYEHSPEVPGFRDSATETPSPSLPAAGQGLSNTTRASR